MEHKNRLDRKKVDFLRNCGISIGHTDGEPFSTACVCIHGLDKLKYINLDFMIDVVEALQKKIPSVQCGIDTFNKAEVFAYYFVQESGILDAVCNLQDALPDIINTSRKSEE